MRILIGDCYHDSDKGGGAILGGLLSVLGEAAGEQGRSDEISLMFRFSSDDPRWQSAARLTSRDYPDLRTLPAPISSSRGPGLRWISWLWKAAVVAPLRLAFPQWSRHPAVRQMRQADVVLFKGGHFYRSWSRNWLADFLAVLIMVYPLLLASRLGKRWSIVSQSMGPFHGRMAKWLIHRALAPARRVICREDISRDILRECGLDDNVQVGPDTAFAAHPASDERLADILRKYGLAAGEYLAVTARPWFQQARGPDAAARRDKCIRGMAKLCDHAAGAGLRVALVVQNDGRHSANEPDEPVLREIQEAMANPQSAVVMNEDFAFDELMAIYGKASLTLGMRLHSCILSTAAGTPCIAVAYAHKTKGIMGMAGGSEFILNIEDFDAAAGTAMIDRLLSRRDEHAALCAARTAQLRSQLLDIARQEVSDKPEAPSSSAGAAPAGARWKTTLRWSVTLILLAGIGWFFYRDRQDLTVLMRIDGWYLAVLLLLQACTIFLYAAKFKIIVDKFAPTVPGKRRFFQIFILGRLLNMFLAQGGNVYRSIVLKSEFGLSHTNYIGSFLALGWLDALLTFTLAAITVPFTSGQAGTKFAVEGALLACIAGCILGPVVSYAIIRRIRPRGKFMVRLHQRVTSLHESLWLLMSDRPLVVRFLLLDMVSFFVMMAIMWASFASLSQWPGLFPLLMLYPLHKLSMLVQVTPGNLGIREVLMGLAGHAISINPAGVMLVSLIMRLSHYLALFLLCVPMLPRAAMKLIRK